VLVRKFARHAQAIRSLLQKSGQVIAGEVTRLRTKDLRDARVMRKAIEALRGAVVDAVDVRIE
jgi:hypothetical protein